MRILKHGTPDNSLHFMCTECGCEWLAVKSEAEQVPDFIVDGNRSAYVMACPDCDSISTTYE